MSCTSQTHDNRSISTVNTVSTTAGGSVPTLSEFLRNCKLSQYYNEFLASGASEDDVPMLLDFTDSEITELCSAISLKPFHIVSLKRGLRMLKEQLGIIPPQIFQTVTSPITTHSTPIVPIFSASSPVCPNATPLTSHTIPTVPSVSPEITNRFSSDTSILISESKKSEYSQSDTTVSKSSGLERAGLPNEHIIKERATIYGRKSARPLTKYEESMNKAAIDIALAEPTLILNRGLLIEKSKAKLLQDGYTYSRGRSRSKLVRTISTSENSHEPSATNGITTPASSDKGYREDDSSSTSDKEHQAIMSGKARRRENRDQEGGESDSKSKSKKHKFEKEREKDGDNKERDSSLRGILHDDHK